MGRPSDMPLIASRRTRTWSTLELVLEPGVSKTTIFLPLPQFVLLPKGTRTFTRSESVGSSFPSLKELIAPRAARTRSASPVSQSAVAAAMSSRALPLAPAGFTFIPSSVNVTLTDSSAYLKPMEARSCWSDLSIWKILAVTGLSPLGRSSAPISALMKLDLPAL